MLLRFRAAPAADRPAPGQAPQPAQRRAVPGLQGRPVQRGVDSGLVLKDDRRYQHHQHARSATLAIGNQPASPEGVVDWTFLCNPLVDGVIFELGGLFMSPLLRNRKLFSGRCWRWRGSSVVAVVAFVVVFVCFYTKGALRLDNFLN